MRALRAAGGLRHAPRVRQGVLSLTERFAAIVGGDEHAIDLGEAALLIAAHAHPDLDVDGQRARLDELAAACGGTDLDALLRLLYVDAGFAGDLTDYYDPRNSFLDDVLDRRAGIPITLAVVGIEVGRRVGVGLVGIGMPAHFLLRLHDDLATFVDPFDGRVLDRAGCRALCHRRAGYGTPFDESFLDPVGPKAILARMLNNLRVAYGRRRDVVSLTWVLRLRVAFPGADADLRAELGRALAAAGQYSEAAALLDALAGDLPERADDLHRRAEELRARLN